MRHKRSDVVSKGGFAGGYMLYVTWQFIVPRLQLQILFGIDVRNFYGPFLIRGGKETQFHHEAAAAAASGNAGI